ncbi:ATP synthase F0 subunit 8, partial [Pseudogymnoascus australis]
LKCINVYRRKPFTTSSDVSKLYLSLHLSNSKNTMPQLVPFYFINQVTFAFIILVTMIYVFSKFILPRFVRLFLSRVFISKL